MKTCELCGRQGDDPYFEEHHLWPVKTRRKTKDTIVVDRQCGDQIHLMFTNQELQQKYHTLEDLKEGMTLYISWVKDKPLESHFPMAKKKRRN